MPRPSRDEIELAHLLPGPHRLQPPHDLDGAARQIFIETVAAVESDHFRPEDSPLIACFARTVVLERQAAAHVGGTEHPQEWAEAHRSLAESLTLLARALALGPKARRPSRPRAGAARLQPSAYDVLFGRKS
jgi:hypothetical protein